jgi:hypothetical protein
LEKKSNCTVIVNVATKKKTHKKSCEFACPLQQNEGPMGSDPSAGEVGDSTPAPSQPDSQPANSDPAASKPEDKKDGTKDNQKQQTPNPFRSLGDATKEWKRRLKTRERVSS